MAAIVLDEGATEAACSDPPPPGCLLIRASGLPEVLPDDHPERPGAGRTSYPIGLPAPPQPGAAERRGPTALDCETMPQMFRRVVPDARSSPGM